MSRKNWTWSQSYKKNARGACREVEAGPTGPPRPWAIPPPGDSDLPWERAREPPPESWKTHFFSVKSFFTGCQESRISPRAPWPLPPLSFHV